MLIRLSYLHGMTDISGLKIRLATAADRAEHLRMRQALWRDEDSPDQLSAEIDELHKAGRGVFFAEADGGAIGFAEVSIRRFVESCDTRNVGYLEGWWVDPTHRWRGVGTRLIESAVNWARERGALEFASACELDNLVSERAHKALGFEETHRTIHFRRPLASDEVIARFTPGSGTVPSE